MPSRLIQPLSTVRVIGGLRAPSAAAAVAAARAAQRGGLRALELSYRTPGCLEALEELADGLPRDTLLGVGGILNARQAAEAIARGARYLVSPHLGEDIMRVARKHNLPYIPGALTPTEIVRAVAFENVIVGLFPVASSGGAAYLRDLGNAFPDLKFLVSGGIEPVDIGGYLEAGALAVTLTDPLFSRRALERGDAEAITAATRAALKAMPLLEAAV